MAEPVKLVRPKCRLIGENGNVFNLLGAVQRALRKNGLYDQAKECSQKVLRAKSYEEALNIMDEYVEII